MSSFGAAVSPVALPRLSAVAANATFVLPAGCVLERVYIRNNTANAVTGGVRIGTTDGGVDVVVALAVGANGMVDTASLLSLLASTATTLYIQAVTLWNGASLDIAFKTTKVF